MAHMEIEDFFAQAVDRLLAGESIDDIVVSYAPGVRRELRGLLVVVEAAERMATANVPAPASLNRVSARLLFAQRTAELRAGLETVQAAAPVPVVQPNRPPADDTPDLWQRLRDWWATVQPPAPVFRFAPLMLVLIAAYLLTFTVVGAAQGSLPGDQIYGLKQWMANQRLATAPPELIVTERRTIAKEQEEDVGKAAEELKAASELAAIETIGIFQYLGEEDDFLLFDGLLVTKGYRTDVSDENSWVPMSGNGELQPGVSVMLRYQIVPGMKGMVEGIDFELIPAPPLPTPEPTPTPTPLPGGGCQRIQPRAWTPYVVGAGETLGGIAARSTASRDELRDVNCLTNGPLRAGTTIYVPARIAAPPQPLQPVITVTPTAAATPRPPVAEPTITPTSTPRAGATATEPAATATESVTESPEATATRPAAETPGAGGTDSATPTDATAEATSRPTTEATPGASVTPAAPVSETPASGTSTPDGTTGTPPLTPGTPAASPTVGGQTAVPATGEPATGTATPASSATPDGATTPVATATPTTLTSTTPATAATSVASSTATSNASPQATAIPTSGASPTTVPAASATAASAATATSAPPTSTQGVAPTATDVTSSASGGSAATNTPTVAPTATSVPPTATKPPAATATPVPPPPTATPVPPLPTATQPPTAPTAADTSVGSESP